MVCNFATTMASNSSRRSQLVDHDASVLRVHSVLIGRPQGHPACQNLHQFSWGNRPNLVYLSKRGPVEQNWNYSVQCPNTLHYIVRARKTHVLARNCKHRLESRQNRQDSRLHIPSFKFSGLPPPLADRRKFCTQDCINATFFAKLHLEGRQTTEKSANVTELWTLGFLYQQHPDDIWTVRIWTVKFPGDIWTVKIWTVKSGLGLGLGLGIGLELVMTVQIMTVQILTVQDDSDISDAETLEYSSNQCSATFSQLQY